jgi:hypothetical protein
MLHWGTPNMTTHPRHAKQLSQPIELLQAFSLNSMCSPLLMRLAEVQWAAAAWIAAGLRQTGAGAAPAGDETISTIAM